MKVTICSYDGQGYFGGPYEWVKRFGPALRDRGVEVSFLFLSDHKASVSSTYQYLKGRGFECRLLQVHSWTNYTDNTEDRVRWFLKQVKDIRPDFFIANAVLPALYAGRWIKTWGIPVVGVLHSDDPTHEYIYDEFITKDQWYALSAVVGVSSVLTEKVLASNPYHLDCATISCGTPMSNKIARYVAEPFKVIYAGKLIDVQKRITDTVHGLCEVVKQLPGVVVELYGGGEQEQKVKAILEDHAKGYSIAWKGKISSDEIQDVFASSQVFVLLSDYEGMPIALMEAMAAGLVPVCTNIKSGIPQLVEHEVTGLLVNNRQEDLVEAVRRLKESSGLWENLSKRARQFVLQEHAMDRIVEKWMVLFSRLAEAKKDRVDTSFSIPQQIVLPPVHPLQSLIDVRKQSVMVYLRSQVSRLKNRFSRMLNREVK